MATTQNVAGNAPSLTILDPAVIRPVQYDNDELPRPTETEIGLNTFADKPAEPEVAAETIEKVPSICDPMNKTRLFAVCLASLANGFNDAGAGAVIPYVETHYGIGYAIVSLIFVGQALGFIFAAIFLDDLRAILGRAKVFGLANIVLVCGYIPIVTTAPFPLIPVAFCLVGFGAAINIALGNLFCGGLQNGTIILGLLHGCYGFGGTISPLIATAIVSTEGTLWSRFYFINLCFAVLVFSLTVWSFWGYEKELSAATKESEKPKEQSTLHAVLLTLRMRIVLLGAIFIFAYQGAEVSISGWVISFLIDARGGSPKSIGYVTAGFWGGITIGRFALSGLGQRWGEKRFVYGFTVIAFVFQLLIWLVPNIIGSSIATAIVGLVLGPIYPYGVAVFMRNMTKRESLQGMVTITAFGSLGGAVAPFVTGLLAQTIGTFVLHPICIFLYAIMLACWYSIPSGSKRQE
ncbi:hypothetical protein FPCIR_914 [Fusarium pseudocircinatum]|uniref:Major facilitator superfamily (MFS) profile domain-containing protein n=1 Tax=Fusarium pseudocircinatum TaxID=56676 RepID=A0A8H5UZZ6_9HYPO|nr:hypothetical protein FPCIR_914 [Fusarium pseudocircinatum]